MTPADSASAPAPSPKAFCSEVNTYLRHCQRAYESHLRAHGDDGVLSAVSAADIARRAHAVFAAIHALFIAPGAPAKLPRLPDPARDAAAAYLPGVAKRMYEALRSKDVAALERLVRVAEESMENISHPDGGAFALVPVVQQPFVPAGSRSDPARAGDAQHGHDTTYFDGIQVDRDVDDVDGLPTHEDRQIAQSDPNYQQYPSAAGVARPLSWFSSLRPGKSSAATSAKPQLSDPFGDFMVPEQSRKSRRRGCCGIRWASLDGKQRLTLSIYIAMVVFSLFAAGYITYQFVRGVVDPEAVLRIEPEDSISAPIVTFCLAKPGVPASRLQMFNYTDAKQKNYVGADPYGPQTDRQSPEFESIVDRFFDNPDGEDCEAVVGDFFPFPLRSLNEIAAGNKSTKCRVCYQVGAKGDPVSVTSTDFASSSYAAFYTDSYFLQCMHNKGGPEQTRALPFMRKAIFNNRGAMDSLNILKSTAGTSVSNLAEADFSNITPEQACNILFFAFFPKSLGRPDNTVDIRYSYNSQSKQWSGIGAGPYFIPPTKQDSFLPVESIEMFVGTNKTTQPGKLPKTSDLAVLGPNSQSYVRFRPLTVFGEDRYDLSSTSSNFITDSVAPLFGYWYLYSVYYGYPRLIRDKIVESNSYPVAQWLVDFFGYLSLFTGLSFFSLLLVPVLQAARRREKRRLKEERPEAYVWQRYRTLTRWRRRYDDDGYDDGMPTKGTTVRGILLP